jgi:hypothetical protein
VRRCAAALVALAAALAVAVGAGPASAAPSSPFATTLSGPAAGAIPAIHHVFIIVLENEEESDTFAPGSPAPYLSKTLTAQGAFLPNYFGIGHNSLDNYIAMIGGQPPTLMTSADCGTFNDFDVGSTLVGDGVESGNGCVYPADVPTIASQLTASGLTWKGYMDSMGADPARESATCGHPAIGTADMTQAKETAPIVDTYATRHDPFVYYHSIIDDQASCGAHVVNLSALPADLQSVATTPNYSFITPGLCNDGHDTAGCAGGGGLAQADSFLQTWVPMITSSPAFQQDGLLLITFDEGEGDSTACCGEIPGPNNPNPGGNGPGGGDVGAVLLSPFIAPGTVSQTAYNHYSMLGSMEDIFGLPHLGYAQLPGETGFGSDVYTRPNGPPASPSPPGPAPIPPSPPAIPVRLLAARAAAARARHTLVLARRALRASQHGHSTHRTLTALEHLDGAEVRLAHANAAVLTAAAG